MNATLKRLAIPAGVAAVIGTSGFAFMANNAVDPSSAGQGSASVSGYTVSHVTYSTEQGWGKPEPTFSVSAVKFILTSAATSAPANGQPASVNAALLGTSANTSDCTITSWTIDGTTGQGSSAVVCEFHQVQPNVHDVTGLDVEANQ